MSKTKKPLRMEFHPGSKAGMTVNFLGSLIINITLLLLSAFETNAQSPSPSKDSLVVSFISIGAGTDYKAKEKLDLFVNDFQTKQQVQLDVSIKHWGREGETDYIYDLSKLSRKQCKAFIEEIEALFAKNNLVKISHRLVE